MPTRRPKQGVSRLPGPARRTALVVRSCQTTPMYFGIMARKMGFPVGSGVQPTSVADGHAGSLQREADLPAGPLRDERRVR